MTYLESIKKAEENNQAVGHFNIANLEMLKAISHVAEKYDTQLIVGTSEGERDYLGVHHSVDLIKSYNKEHNNEGGYHLFLNADHTYSLEKIKEAAEVGYDSVIFDGSELDLEENVKKTKEAVDIAKSINTDILVEGELGFIGKSSNIKESVPEGAVIKEEDLPTPEQAKDFVERTGVDLLAPAVGNMHGVFKGADNPDLKIDLIKRIREAAGVPLVLHGGSGVTDENFRKAIKAGISVIHVSTEMRIAYRNALEEVLKEKPDELAPYRLLPEAMKAVETVVEEKVKLFLNK